MHDKALSLSQLFYPVENLAADVVAHVRAPVADGSKAKKVKSHLLIAVRHLSFL